MQKNDADRTIREWLYFIRDATYYNIALDRLRRFENTVRAKKMVKAESEYGCRVCGSDTDGKHGIPMHEDIVRHNGSEEEWAGQHACEPCYYLQGLLNSRS